MVREIVGTFDSREAFDQAVNALLARGISRDRLSALSTHEAVEAAEPHSRWADLGPVVADETKYVGPIAAAGMIALAAGPVGAAIAGLVGAGLTVGAARDLIQEWTASDQTDRFARALEYGGALLWVRVETETEIEAARDALAAAGGEGIHLHERPPVES